MKTTGKASKPSTRTYHLERQVGFLLRQVNQRHTAIFATRMGNEITTTQWAAMSRLYEIGPTSQNQLGRLTAMDVATIKGVVDRLTKRGLIGTTSDESDARRRLVTLTEEGKSLVEARISDAHAITVETMAPLLEAERKLLLDLLAKMR